MPRLGFDRVPFVLPPLMAMDSAMRPTSGITYDGALPATAALDTDITFDDEPEEPGDPSLFARPPREAVAFASASRFRRTQYRPGVQLSQLHARR